VGQTIGEALGSFVSDLLPFLVHSHFLRRSVYTPTNPILLELIDQLLVVIVFLFFSKYFCLTMGLASKLLGIGDRKLQPSQLQLSRFREVYLASEARELRGLSRQRTPVKF
jgi:hypothetical protein